MRKYRIVRRPIGGVGHYFVQRKGWFFWADIDNTSNWASSEGFPFITQALAEEHLALVLIAIEDMNTKDIVVVMYETGEQG